MTPPAAHEIFQRYVQDRRGLPLRGFRYEVQDHLDRYSPLRPDLEGIVMFADLDAVDVDAAIDAQVAHFAALGCAFEWKTYEFDRPGTLASRLTAHGFERKTPEAFMVYPTESHRSRGLRDGVTVERVNSAAAIRTIVRLQSEIWRETLDWLEQSLIDGLPDSLVLLGCVAGEPVGTGWINFPRGSSFADLHGGAVLPEFRGRGAYSALFDRRAEEAKQRGVPFVSVDAAPMSRPILLRQGFQFICETTPYRWSPAALG